MKPKTIVTYALCGMIIIAVGTAEEFNPHLAGKIPDHIHQEVHYRLVDATSPSVATGGTITGYVSRG